MLYTPRNSHPGLFGPGSREITCVRRGHFMPDALDRQKTQEDDSLTDENWPLG